MELCVRGSGLMALNALDRSGNGSNPKMRSQFDGNGMKQNKQSQIYTENEKWKIGMIPVCPSVRYQMTPFGPFPKQMNAQHVKRVIEIASRTLRAITAPCGPEKWSVQSLKGNMYV